MSDNNNQSSGYISDIIKQGYMSLEDRDWDSASLYFSRAISMDDKSEKAYLGMAFSDAHVSGFNELRLSLEAAVQAPEPEELIAYSVKIEDKISEIIRKNTIPGYYYSYDIEDILDVDSTYFAYTTSWEVMMHNAKSRFYSTNMKQAIQYGDKILKNKVDRIWERISTTYDKVIKKSEKNDAGALKRKLKERKKSIKKSLSIIKKQRRKAQKQRKKDYKYAIKLYKKDKRQALLLLADKKLVNFKKSRKYIIKSGEMQNLRITLPPELPKNPDSKSKIIWKKILVGILSAIITGIIAIAVIVLIDID